MRTLLTLLIFLLFIGTASAQIGNKYPNGHWSYPGSAMYPEGITQHLLGPDHRHELRQSLNGLSIDEQQTLHDLIHINRRTGTVHCVPYIGPKIIESNIQLKPVQPNVKIVPELVLTNI